MLMPKSSATLTTLKKISTKSLVLTNMEQITFAKDDAQLVLMVTVVRNANRGFGATLALDVKVRDKLLLMTLLGRQTFAFRKPLSDVGLHFLFIECKCSNVGSLENACDDVTGKCNCKQGFKGDMCEICPNALVLELDEYGVASNSCYSSTVQGK